MGGSTQSPRVEPGDKPLDVEKNPGSETAGAFQIHLLKTRTALSRVVEPPKFEPRFPPELRNIQNTKKY